MLPLLSSEPWPRFLAPLIVSLLWVISGSLAPILAQPDVPTLLTPLNGAIDVPNTVDLRWASSANATRYNVEVATDSEVKNKILQVNVPGTQTTFNAPSQGTTYFWRVSAVGPGGRSAYSTTFHFTTILLKPGRPELLAPADGAVDEPNQLTLRWSKVAHADRYDVQVFSDSMKQDEVFHENTPGGMADFTAPSAGSTYFWRVQAFGPGGATASILGRFTTSGTAGSLVPFNLMPEDGATGVPIDPLVTWSPPEPDSAQSYHLQIATNETFDSLVVDVDSIDATSYQVTGLEYETMYCWRVAGADRAGNETFSPSQNFTTVGAPPGIAQLVSPDDGATGVSALVQLAWEAVEGADRYEVQVATDSDFTSLLVTDTTAGTTFDAAEPYAYSTTHYWRVRAGNENGFGEYSEVRSFTTATGVANETDQLPTELALGQNYPNPFNPSTHIEYALPRAAGVRIVVFDALGRAVSTLVDGRMPAGNHAVEWTAQGLVSGVYFYRMETGDFVGTKRMTLLK